MKRATFLKASLISKGIIATCAIVGFLMQMTLHGWHGLRYYTNQSNLLVGLFMVYLLLKYRKDGHWSKMDLRLKGGVTVAILLTGLVYHFMLAPQKTAEEFWTIENFLSHYIVRLGHCWIASSLIKGIAISGMIHLRGRYCRLSMRLYLWRLHSQPVFRLEITKMAHSHISS